MDTITHGLAGALIAKAFFAEAPPTVPDVGAQHAAPGAGHPSALLGTGAPPISNTAARIALWVATLGSIFPDSDSVLDAFDPTGMAVITEHRGLTHSLLLLPLWALAFAALTRWLAQRRGWACPSFARLAVIWGAGILSHIVLDLINSWGTMIWMPLERTRVAWDLTFVIDLTLSAILLTPQIAAWAYRRQQGSTARRMGAWMLVCLGAVAVDRLARVTGFAFSPWVVAVVSVLAAGLFMLPRQSHWGFRVSSAAWCRAGCLALAAYLALCWGAHRAAVERVQEFASQQQLQVENLAAIPMPPSLTRWSGLIRTPRGVYQARFSLLDRQPPFFRFVHDAEASAYIEAARKQRGVQDFLWFARFPVARTFDAGNLHVVEWRDLRFFNSGPRRQNPFTYRVTLDAAGQVLSDGWVE